MSLKTAMNAVIIACVLGLSKERCGRGMLLSKTLFVVESVLSCVRALTKLIPIT